MRAAAPQGSGDGTDVLPGGGEPSPFALATQGDAAPDVASDTVTGSSTEERAPSVPRVVPPPSMSEAELAAIGTTSPTNAQFDALVARLRTDPAALGLLIEAFRAETGRKRLDRLATVLGTVGHSELASIGAQMVGSGDPLSRDAGLRLLQQLQPHDEGAREVLVGLLGSETDPAVLGSIIDAVALPGEKPGAQGSGALVAQLVPLTRHASAAVRRNGITVLSRWADDADVAPVLEEALSDPDRGVRLSAVYAFANQSGLAETVKQELLGVLENANETRGTRSGALLALQRADLDREQRRRVEAGERDLASQL